MESQQPRLPFRSGPPALFTKCARAQTRSHFMRVPFTTHVNHSTATITASARAFAQRAIIPPIPHGRAVRLGSRLSRKVSHRLWPRVPCSRSTVSITETQICSEWPRNGKNLDRGDAQWIAAPNRKVANAKLVTSATLVVG